MARIIPSFTTAIILVASAALLAGCTLSTHEGANLVLATTPANPAVSVQTDRASWADSLAERLGSVSAESDQAGCPGFTESEAQQLFAAHVTITHDYRSSNTSADLHCRIIPFGDSGTPKRHGMTVVIERTPIGSDKNTNNTAAFLKRAQQPVDGAPLLANATKDYPGFGVGSESLNFSWLCGPYSLRYNVTERHDTFRTEVDPASSLESVVKGRIEQLCGTVENPSMDVRNEAQLSWAIFDSFGGTNPTTLNIPRPTGLKPLLKSESPAIERKTTIRLPRTTRNKP